MSASGIIFSNIHDNNIPELTRLRTIASVPFACRYRLIDFTLSNMVNSNIYNINLITHYNYQSLMDHIGSGKDWDLARRGGGIKVLPPYITGYSSNGSSINYATRLEALKGVINSISRITDEYVVLSDCDVIANIDFNDMISYHQKSGADMTIAVKTMELDRETAKNCAIYNSDENGRINEVLAYPNDYEGKADIALSIIVMSTAYLRQIVADAITHGYTSLTRDIIARNCERMNYQVYRIDGYFSCITSFADYYRHSMDLLTNTEMRESLFNVKNRPIYTKVRNSTPTKYSDDAMIKNSLIADGCVIEGTVENSILFRGVKVGKNTVVKNSILFQDTYTGNNVNLNCVVTDKNVVIRDYRTLSGSESMPFCIEKGKMI